MSRLLRKLVWQGVPIAMLAGAGVLALQGPQHHGDRRQARQRGRGRRAGSPLQIPLKGWKDILVRTRKEFADDQIPMIAAGVSFYTLLAVFPALAVFVALYGLFADINDVQHHLHVLSFFLPASALKFFGAQMVRMAEAQKGGLSLTLIIGLLTSIWSANGAVRALLTGLNIAYEEGEKRGFVRKTLISLAFTVGLLAFGVAAITVLGAGPAVETLFGEHAAMVVDLISWPALVVSVGVGMALLYHFGPSRDPVQFRWVSWGSGAALVLWLIVSAGFSLYVGNFAHYDKTYGSLGAVVGFLIWNWLTNLIILAGAELNSEIEHQVTADTTVGRPEPMGFRHAKMADTVGAAQTR